MINLPPGITSKEVVLITFKQLSKKYKENIRNKFPELIRKGRSSSESFRYKNTTTRKQDLLFLWTGCRSNHRTFERCDAL